MCTVRVLWGWNYTSGELEPVPVPFIPAIGVLIAMLPGDAPAAMLESHPYWLICTEDGETVESRIFTYQGAIPTIISPGELAQRAKERLPLLYPEPSVNPPNEQLVGLESWLWVPAEQWAVRSATASVPGLSATVTAEPVE
ncbi:MAG: hypothetical protein ACRD0U_17410, partial [Acidimicrobiales bacterium]